jgi:2-dehydropantoate 2-reductase
MRIIIEGIGGVGGVLAARIIASGHRPLLITGNPAITDAMNTHGIRAITPEGELMVPAAALTSLKEVKTPDGFDVALLVMKAGQVTEAAEKTLPLLAPEGYVVTLQNGIVEDRVAEIVGKRRIVSGIVGFGGTFVEPGVVEKTGPGKIHIGELDNPVTDRVRRLAALLEAVSPVVMTDNMRGALWSKLAINSTITTLGALTGDTLGVMLKTKPAREAFLRVYREVVDTSRALGVRLERIATDPGLLYLSQNGGGLQRFYKDALVRIVGRKYRKLRSSSLQSLERGRKTEIDYLNGYVVKKAREVGVDVPLNDVLVRMIKEIEAGRRTIEGKNMVELLTV